MITHEDLIRYLTDDGYVFTYDESIEREITEYENALRADERRKFAEWLTKSDYANGYFDTGSRYVAIDKVLAEYEKEHDE